MVLTGYQQHFTIVLMVLQLLYTLRKRFLGGGLQPPLVKMFTNKTKGMSISRGRDPLNVTVLSAAAATGWSTEVDIREYRHVFVVISSASSFAGTVKVATSVLERGSVAFSSAAAVGNEWDYIGAWNLNIPATVAGNTGVVYSGTDAVEQLEVNTDGMSSLAVHVSAYSAGAVTVKVFAVNNA